MEQFLTEVPQQDQDLNTLNYNAFEAHVIVALLPALSWTL